MTASSLPPSHEEDHNYAVTIKSTDITETSSRETVITTTKTQSTTTSINLRTNSQHQTQERETASHGESTSYEIVDETRGHAEEAKVIIKSPSKKHIHRTSSRDRARVHRSDSVNLYELSTDIADKAIECLEKKYGGKERANQAARAIQQCYRHWVLNKGFKRVRAYSGRKRSLTMPEKQFQKLKQKSLFFYGPDNPVMIVDGEIERTRRAPIAQFEDTVDEGNNSDSNVPSDEKKSEQNIVEIAHEEGMKMYSQGADDSDDGEDETDGNSTDDKLEKSTEIINNKNVHDQGSETESSGSQDEKVNMCK